MSRLRFPKILTPPTPLTNHGELFHSNIVTPADLAFITEAGTVQRVNPGSVKLTADRPATSSGNIMPVPGLAFSVVAGGYYHFRFGIIWQVSVATLGSFIGMSWTMGTNSFSATVRSPQAADGTNAMFHGVLQSSGDAVGCSSAETANTSTLSIIDGVVAAAQPGTMWVNAGAEVTGGGNFTVKQGSWGMLYEI